MATCGVIRTACSDSPQCPLRPSTVPAQTRLTPCTGCGTQKQTSVGALASRTRLAMSDAHAQHFSSLLWCQVGTGNCIVFVQGRGAEQVPHVLFAARRHGDVQGVPPGVAQAGVGGCRDGLTREACAHHAGEEFVPGRCADLGADLDHPHEQLLEAQRRRPIWRDVC